MAEYQDRVINIRKTYFLFKYQNINNNLLFVHKLSEQTEERQIKIYYHGRQPKSCEDWTLHKFKAKGIKLKSR